MILKSSLPADSNPEYASNLQYLAESIEWAIDVKINSVTRSIAVEFDQQAADVNIVYPGDRISVDGFVLNGTGIVDRCKLTGKSIPVTRSMGDEVFASTLLVDGNLCILTERTGITRERESSSP